MNCELPISYQIDVQLILIRQIHGTKQGPQIMLSVNLVLKALYVLKSDLREGYFNKFSQEY
jgi:hypothetical protein